MNITEQAINLLDIDSATQKKKSIDNFLEMEKLVSSSFSEESTASSKSESKIENPYSVAGRLSSTNYEARAKNEALVRALQQLRQSHGPKTKNTIIRGV